MKDSVGLPVPRPLGLIRLDGPDVVRDAGPQLFDQLVGLALDLGPGGGGAVSASSVNLVGLEQFLEELLLGRLHQLDQVDGENVFVPFHETVHVVCDHAGVVVDNKTRRRQERNVNRNISAVFPGSSYPGPAVLKCWCWEKDCLSLF